MRTRLPKISVFFFLQSSVPPEILQRQARKNRPLDLQHGYVVQSFPRKAFRYHLSPLLSFRSSNSSTVTSALDHGREVADRDSDGEVDRCKHDGEENPPSCHGGHKGTSTSSLGRMSAEPINVKERSQDDVPLSTSRLTLLHLYLQDSRRLELG